MMLFLQVVGAAVVSLLVLAIGAWLTLRWYLRRKFGDRLMKLMEQGHAPVVARISLSRSTAPPHNADAVAALIAALHRLGYRKVGWFAVPEMQGMQLWAGTAPDGSAGVVYDHPALEPFFDLVRMHEDDTSLTVSSTRMHNPDNVPPGCIVVHDPAMTPAQARARLESTEPDRALRVLDASNFVQEFQAAYARGMDHMLANRASPTREELELHQRQWDGPRQDLSEEQVEDVLRAVRSDRMAALHDAIVDRFLESGQVSAHQWQRLGERVVVVHQQMSVEEAIELAIRHAEPGTDLRAATAQRERLACPLEAFAAANACLEESLRHTEIGSTQQPVQARLYAAPA